MSTTEIRLADISKPREQNQVGSPRKASAADRWIGFSVFVLSCLYLCLFLRFTNLNGDEGIVLQGAERILHGEVLYRDFFSFYTPGSYYWLALLFRTFANSMLVARATLVAYGGVFSLLTYVLARRVCAQWSSLLAAYLLTLTCLPYRFLVSHWEGTLLAYLTLYCVVRFFERPNWAWVLLAGSSAALTCLFEQPKGAGLVLGLFLGYMVIAWTRPLFRRQLWILLTGSLWPFVLTFVYFASKGALRQMLAAWTWPLFHYWITNKVPYGYVVMSPAGLDFWSGTWGSRAIMLIVLGPLLLIPVLPILALGIFLWVTFSPSGRRRLGEKWSYWVIVSACLSGLLFSLLATKRPDFTHILYLAPLFYLVFAWTVDGLQLDSRLWRVSAPILVLYSSLSSTAFGLSMLWPRLGAHHQVSTVRGKITTDDDRTLDYVQANVSPGQKIFVYPYEPMYYYLTGTFSSTRFDFLQLGMHTPEQFRESLRSLELDRTPVVLFETSITEKLAWTSPETPLQLLAAKDPVQDYILAHYRRCAGPMTNSYWRFEFMMRKDLSCPVLSSREKSALGGDCQTSVPCHE
jgi:Dolichyl-phosphate-mannose-protein mannosyltransferase